MLSTRLDQWEEQTQKKGFEKDREENKQLRKSTLLYRQPERRYGSLPEMIG